ATGCCASSRRVFSTPAPSAAAGTRTWRSGATSIPPTPATTSTSNWSPPRTCPKAPATARCWESGRRTSPCCSVDRSRRATFRRSIPFRGGTEPVMPDEVVRFFQALASTVLWSLVAIILVAIVFEVLDKRYKLIKEIFEENSSAAAILAGSFVLGIFYTVAQIVIH